VRLIQLRDGSIQFGRILQHDPDGFVLERLDTGGRARLPWSLLDPAQDSELRTAFGYVDLTGEEIYVAADRITTNDGLEIVGRVIDRTDDAILLKTSSGTIPIPKSRLSGVPTQVQANALEIWTRAELYAQQQATSDLTSALGQFELARFCERILDFTHAAEHYQEAQRLDPAFRRDELVLALTRAREKAARQDQIEWLAAVDDLVGRRRFDEALAQADAFAQKFPDSPLLPDAKKKRDRAVKALERYLSERIARAWFVKAARIARDKGLSLSFEGALGYLDAQMSQDVLAAVTQEAQSISQGIDADTVRRFWQSRRRERWQRASYGLGTWMLGREAALKGEQPAAEEAAPKSETEKVRADLEQKLKKFLQNQEMARKSKSSADQKDEREEAWKMLPGVARAGWLLAYYAENGGDFELHPRPLFSNCRECGGTGTRLVTMAGANVSRESIGQQANEQVIECPTCHGIGAVRRVSFR
jgi:hypothetical protein